MIDKLHLLPQIPATGTAQPEQNRASAQAAQAFNKVLAQELARPEWQSPELPADFPLKLSSHAEKRVYSRGVNLTEYPGAELDARLGEAQRRGAKSALVMSGEAALLVNVPERTVITAFSPQDLRERVITDIDSVILLKQ
jgi:flagellar operon protein